MDAIIPVPDLLKHHAEARGQQPAFAVPGGRTVTYVDLAERTERIAGHLAGVGVTRGHRVALVLPGCIEAVESTYAVARASAVGVPLDPRSSGAELSRALKHSDARVVITDHRRLNRVRVAVDALSAGADTRDLLIVLVAPGPDLDLGGGVDVNIAALIRAPKESERRGLSPNTKIVRFEHWAGRPAPQRAADNLGLDEPAWLHYTTGTTGKPKGVVSSQRAYLWTAIVSYRRLLGMTSADTLFWPLPLFHSFGHSFPIIGTLVTGSSTYLPGDERPPDGLPRLPQKVTVIGGTPTTFQELVTALATRSASHASSLPRPRACICAGAPAPADLSGQVEELLGVPLLNHYGSSESCGPVASHYPGDSFCQSSCGFPLPGIHVKLMDPHPERVETVEVADGYEGEIWIRSPSLMLGYDDDNGDLQPPPLVTTDGWYRTGDLGRRTGPGFLSVTGRLKELILRGGENIHPDEIERVLRACPGVADVVVAGVPHDILGEVPAAFVVPALIQRPDGDQTRVDMDVTALLTACRRTLPDYKVPVTFYTIDAVPRTASGKPKRLAAVNLIRTGACRPLTAGLLTEDSLETLVLVESASVCGGGDDVLAGGPEQLHSRLPFTAFGLNSLASVVLRDRLAALTGLNLPLTVVFDHPTPAALSQYLRGRLFGTRPPRSIPPASHAPDSLPQSAVGVDDIDDPVAIISMACRYPGGISSPEDLWRVVSQGVDTSSDFPTDRGWDLEALYDPDPNKNGTCTTRRGGFLHDMADFDARLCGISPREALATDPQQRLLLETTWELVERARIAPSSLGGTDTGVYAGIIYSEYASRFAAGAEGEYEAHLRLGSDPGVAAGRISYTFDLHGPSMAVNAGCSSSLVAVHLAAGALRSRECSLAIAGGATVMVTPHQLLMFSRQRGLSPDGRCRSYSADADGTAWSEGVGLVLLERLSDARCNGHHVLGLVRGSAVNSDGTSNGLTAPNGLAQQRVIQQALSQASLSAADVDVLEGHGTATPLGDPIEVEAILSTYGDQNLRSASRPLLLGSVKSNIGHTQAAAGIAGVIKMIQAMNHGVAPASLNISKPSSHVDWSSGAVELLVESKPWPRTPADRPRRAAVSSFGIGGTNAHLILEQDIPTEGTHGYESRRSFSAAFSAGRVYPWILSGADDAAMRAHARAVSTLVDDQDPLDVAVSLATTRASLAHRAAVTATSREATAAALLALAEGRPHPDVFTGVAGAGRSRAHLAFLFSGQGSQRRGMSTELRAHFPVFEAAFREVCDELGHWLERPLAEVLQLSFAEGLGSHLLDRADYAQAAIFAFEVALYRLLESFGYRPDFVVGHSAGEIAAAHVAGVLSLADAAMLVAARGTLMAALPCEGTMASVAATEEEVATVLPKTTNDNVGVAVVAAVNADDSVVISGTTAAVEAIMKEFSSQGRPTTRLNVSHAYHSPLMSPVVESLGQTLHARGLSTLPGRPKISFLSTVTGKPVEDAKELSADYWVRHLVAPVRFGDAIRKLSTLTGPRVATCVDIGPRPALARHVPGALAVSGESEVNALLRGLGQLWVRGIQPSVDNQGVESSWQTVFAGSGARVIDLPVYPFQRRRYWLDAPGLVSAASEGNESCTDSVRNASSGQITPATPSTPTDQSLEEQALQHLVSGATSRPPAAAAQATVPHTRPDQLAGLPPKERRLALLCLVQDEVATVLGYESRRDVPASAWDRSLFDLGFDSFMGILLWKRLSRWAGQRQPVGLDLNNASSTTVPALVEELLSRM